MADSANPFAQYAETAAELTNPFAQFAVTAESFKGPKISQLEAAGRGALQGVTLNWADEIFGYGKNLPKLVTEGKDAYLRAAEADTKSSRAAFDAAREQHPGSFVGGEVAGAVLPSLAALAIPGGQAAGAANLANVAIPAAKLLPRMAQGAKVGAGYGAVAGAGGAVGPDGGSLADQAINTGSAALKGGAFGAAVGSVVPPALDLGAAALRPIANVIRAKRNPERMAADMAVKAFDRDTAGKANITSSQALYQDPHSIIADLGGDNVRSKMRSALNVPNDERTRFNKVLDARAEEQWSKIEKGMVDALGDPKSYYASADALIATRSAMARPAFKAAFDAPFQYDAAKFADVMQRPAMNRIKDMVEDQLLNEGVKGAPRTGEVFNNSRPLEIIHRIKVKLDDLIDDGMIAKKMGNASSADKIDLRSLVTLKSDLMKAVEASGGDGPVLYSRALKNFADSAQLERSLKLGYEHAATKEAPEVVKQTLAKMSGPEQELYRLGVARKWAETNRGGSALNDRTKRDWTAPDRLLMLDEVVKGPKERKQFVNMIEALTTQHKTRQAAQGNSTTARQLLEAQNDAQPVEILKQGKNALTGNWSALLDYAARKSAPLGGMTQDVAGEYLKLMSAPISPAVYRGNAPIAPYQWNTVNQLGGLPSVQDALTRRAQSAQRIGAYGAGITRGTNALYND